MAPVTGLVGAAVTHRRDMVSLMVRLRAGSAWERFVIPAFVAFFAQLYPFSRVNGPGGTAAAAGGCMVVRRSALEAAGGLEQIRDRGSTTSHPAGCSSPVAVSGWESAARR